MSQSSESSLLRVAGAGFRLSLLLNAAACQLAQSRIEIHSIAKGISLFALTLKHHGQLLERSDLDYTTEATVKAHEIANQGQTVFVEIEHMLDKLQGTDAHEELRQIPVQERLKWCFRKQHVTYLLAHLESFKLSLIVMGRILQLGALLRPRREDVRLAAPEFAVDDMIAQEKAETQNMIIVRYWALKRLDRLWDLVAQEAVDAANDPTNRKILAAHSSSATSSMGSLLSAAQGSDPTKLAVVSFGDSDISLANLERSPKDMVHLSESAMNQLLILWVPALNSFLIGDARTTSSIRTKHNTPRAHLSSDGEDEDSDGSDWDGHGSHGYYLEGTTHDWRKPHSQEARQRAAELRRQYSGFQAQVESDPEEHRSRRARGQPKDSRVIDSSDDEEEQPSSGVESSKKKVTIQDPNRSSRYPPSPVSDRGPPSWNRGYPPMPPSQPIPRTTVPPPNMSGPPNQAPRYPPPSDSNRTAPRSIPNSQSNSSAGSLRIPSPRGTPPSQYENPWSYQPNHNPNLLHPRPHPAPYSSSSPESSVRFRSSPPRSAPRSPSRPHRKSSREEARERHKAMTRSATRGLVGIGAIAGFMDALEAFSLL
ncbi:hypothetical protein PDE_02820 [Penicillium oxalicum 114-2]|uniref:Uncharacterized protein n=1 Tax=Penicillium oxalicum (strain 114-2 / CGMCC 5302) TaxID=933388 RepID=S7ZGW5_PENO1|nr:hypothetical protein PDE_02820 [Penicillium oxalicum 114-2]